MKISLLSRKSTAKMRYGSRFSVFGSPFSRVLPIFAESKYKEPIISKRMKRKLIITIFLLVAATVTWAQSSPQLVVWQKNGEKVYIDLSEIPETTFKGDQLVIRGSKTSVQYPLSNILRYTYENVSSTGIELQPSERMVSISKNGDSVTLRNLREGSTVTLYSSNGTLLEQRTINNAQPLTFSIAQRPAGVYIVKAGSETIKLMKQ
jgi:hypothetical protein